MTDDEEEYVPEYLRPYNRDLLEASSEASQEPEPEIPDEAPTVPEADRYQLDLLVEVILARSFVGPRGPVIERLRDSDLEVEYLESLLGHPLSLEEHAAACSYIRCIYRAMQPLALLL